MKTVLITKIVEEEGGYWLYTVNSTGGKSRNFISWQSKREVLKLQNLIGAWAAWGFEIINLDILEDKHYGR